MGLIGLFARIRIAAHLFTVGLIALAEPKRNRKEFVMEIFLILLMSVFVLWLGTKILDKAGIDKIWVLSLLIPVVNIFMIWVFAFSHWPKLKSDVKQDL